MNRPSLMDPNFRYRRAAETDIRKTFARVRREMKEAEESKQAANVRPIKRAKEAK